MEDGMKYPHNVLEAFGNGCLLDFRVRIALNLLATSPLFHGLCMGLKTAEDASKFPSYMAGLALELADEVLGQAEAKGWVDALPEEAELNSALKKQAKRTARYNALQQIEGNRAMQDEQSGISRVAPILAGKH